MFFCGYSYWYHLSLVVISEYLFKISVLMKVDLNSRGIDALARFLRFSQRGDNFWDWIPLLLWKEVHSERKDLLLKNKLFPCREEPYDSGCENILTELHSSCVYLDPLRKEYQSCMAVSLVDLICTAISAITFLTLCTWVCTLRGMALPLKVDHITLVSYFEKFKAEFTYIHPSLSSNITDGVDLCLISSNMICLTLIRIHFVYF